MNLSQYLIEQLAGWGVRHVYGVIGDAILPLMDELSRQQKLRFVPVCHESAAGFAASAEAKLTGRPAVCVGTSGPGLANLINGVADAYADRVPLLVLTGQVESHKVGGDVKQYVHQQGLIQGITGYTETLPNPAAIEPVLLRALKTAVGEGRPAHIGVPKDFWKGPVQAPLYPPEPYLTAPPVTGGPVIEEAAGLIRRADRPLILAGHGASGAAGEVAALAEVLGAGILLALGGKGMLPDLHPLVLGGVGTGGSPAAHRALGQADLILVVGSTWWPAPYMPEGVQVVQVDRHPASIGSLAPATYGLPGDAAQVLPGLLAALRRDPGPDRSGWRAQLSGLKRDWEATREAEGAIPVEAPGAVPPAALVRALEQAAPGGGRPGAPTIFTLDTGDHLLWFNRQFRGAEYRTLFSGTWRSMGFALPAAIAAKLCRPEASVLALVGDGGLTTLLGELRTAVQESLDLTVVVARNGSLAMEEHKAVKEGYQPFGHQLRNPDFAAVARAFGWQAWRVEQSAQLLPALQEAAAHPGPALVDVATVNDPSLYR
ncbi:MAG: thiamine pyrophosphate-binding protein [Bacillota bacterium]